MKKIPIKIVELTSPSGKKGKEVMLDVFDYYEIENAQKKLSEFKKKYFETVEKASKIMPKKKPERNTYHFWAIGKLLYDFNKSIENEFEIKNYNPAIIRDFGLYDRSHVGHILQFGEFFTKKDLDNSIPMSTYLELIWKSSFFKKLGLLEKEKKRLLKMSKEKTLPPHKTYREELNQLVKSLENKNKEKK